MLNFRLSEIAAAIGASFDGKTDGKIEEISLDSRAVNARTLFIAIRGERFDGHDYIDSALENGAAAAVSMRPEDGKNPRVLTVENTEQALCDIARAHRMKFRIPVVGVTGSVGKTTTKDMIACVLGEKYRVKKTEANHNNQIGMPKTLLELTESDEAAVMEMGSQGPGDVRQLTFCAMPLAAVITKIGVSHLEQFGTRENILRGKLEIGESLPENGTLILNGDDPYLMSALEEQRRLHHVVTYAIDNHGADLYAEEISGGAYSQSFILCRGEERASVYLPVGGLHNVYNALAALSAGLALGVDLQKGIDALGRFEPSGQRQRMTPCKGRTVIEDCYNASPDSMDASLHVLTRCDEGPKIAVLGDMLELGDIAETAHRQIGELAASLQVDLVLCLGPQAKWICEGAQASSGGRTRAVWFDDPGLLIETLLQAALPGSTILFKASHGMHFEKLIEEFTARLDG